MKKNLRMAVTAGLTLGVVSLGGVQAFAADEDRTADEHMLGETVVTATRTPNKELKANANITVITGKDIERRHYTDLTQALRDVPGVTVNQYGPAGYNNSNNIENCKLTINSFDEVDITSQEIISTIGEKPGPWIKSVVSELEHEILLNRLDNNRKDILDFLSKIRDNK